MDYRPRSAEERLNAMIVNFRRLGHLSRGQLSWLPRRSQGQCGSVWQFKCLQFHEGWFEDTMPLFSEPVAADYLDVTPCLVNEDVLETFLPFAHK
jgi:hypothetical protein